MTIFVLVAFSVPSFISRLEIKNKLLLLLL